MSTPYEVLRDGYVLPEGLSAATSELSPLDMYANLDETYLSWPLFFDYDINADRLIGALEKLCLNCPFLCGRLVPHKETRYTIEVDPEKEGAHGFPFSELKSEMSIATALLEHSQIKGDSAEYPSDPMLPFFMEKLDLEALVKSVSFSRSQLLMGLDIRSSIVTLASSIVDWRSRREISIVHVCGQISWLSTTRSWERKQNTCLGLQLRLRKNLSLYPFPERPADMRHSTSPRSTLPDLAALHLGLLQEVLDNMKEIAKPYLSEGQFVSTNDLMVALGWMLKSELDGENDPAADDYVLDISDTLASCTVELLMNGIGVIPKNYFGNGTIYQFLASHGLELEKKSLPEIFSTLALLMRKGITDLKEQPQIAAQAIMVLYAVVHSGVFPMDTSKARMVLTNLTKMPIAEVDFGNGPPRAAHLIATLPLVSEFVAIGSFPARGDGVLMHFLLCESRYSRLKNSKVLEACAPGAKLFYSEMTVDDLEALIKP